MQLFRIVSLLAWRNLWRNYRRTTIMLTAVVVGVWAMIFMTALMRGMIGEMVRDSIEFLPGHVQVHHPAFADDPSIGNLLPLTDSELASRLAGNGFLAWSTRINVPAVVMSERDLLGVTLYGIDPQRERGLTFLADAINAGRHLDDAADNGIVVGRKLLETLDSNLGKRLVIMSQDPDNDIAERGFRVVGVFAAALESREETMVFAGKNTVQAMLGVDDRVTEIAVRGAQFRDVEPLRRRVATLFNDDVAVQSWTELNPYLGTMVNVMDGFVLVWIVMIFVALSFGLVNTLVMAVFERMREIGLMLALGMQPRVILLQVLAESLLLLVIGLAAGTTLAWLTVMAFSDGIDLSVVSAGMEMMGAASILYPELTLHDVLLANAVVLALGLLASVSPAWRASRYEPVEAITRV